MYHLTVIASVQPTHATSDVYPFLFRRPPEEKRLT